MGRVRLILLAAVLLVALVPPAGAQAAKKMEVAIQDDGAFLWRTYYSRTKAFKQAGELKVSRIRLNILWSVVAKHSRRKRVPKRIRYRWAMYDSVVKAARKRGIKVQAVLTGPAPAWATKNRRRGPYRPNPKRFEHFVKAATKHFKGRIDRYSIWNEPNHVSWLAPKRAQARMYRQLYKRGYRTVKRYDRKAKVLIGETAPYASKPERATPPLLFLRKVTCVNSRYKRRGRCKPLFADGFAHHPYEYKHSPRYRFPGRDNVTMGTLSRLVRALNKLAARKALRTPKTKRRLNIYLTEFGYFARGKYRVGERRRARWLRQAFDIARRHKRVKGMLQYLLVRPSRAHRFFDTSIVNRNGKTSRTYRTLRSWARKMAKGKKIAVPKPPRRRPPGGGSGGGNPGPGPGDPGGGGGGGGGDPDPGPECPLGLPVCP